MDALYAFVFKTAAAVGQPQTTPVAPSAPPAPAAPVSQSSQPAQKTIVLGGRPATPQITGGSTVPSIAYQGTPVGGVLLSDAQMQEKEINDAAAQAEAAKNTKSQPKPEPAPIPADPAIISGAITAIHNQIKSSGAAYESPSGGAIAVTQGPAGRFEAQGKPGEAGSADAVPQVELLPSHWSIAPVVNKIYNAVRPALLGNLIDKQPGNIYTQALENTPGSLQGAAAAGLDPMVVTNQGANPWLNMISRSVGSAVNQSFGNNGGLDAAAMDRTLQDLGAKFGWP